MRITFVNLQEKNIKPFREAFAGLDNISFYKGNITNIMGRYDCIVSPANGFGIMNGGIDKAISYYYPDVMKNVHYRLDHVYHGEQPVGTCMFVSTGQSISDEPSRILAHCPTMRIPKNIASSENAYLAFKALLYSVNYYNKHNEKKIETIVTTSFCNGSGSMPIERSAKQMRLAYKHIMEEPPMTHIWPEAHLRAREIETSKFS